MKIKIPIYQVDAFTSKVFSGNPAAVCLLDEWLDDDILQAIAQENNLSETAFLVPVGKDYHIRWFTPVTEVELCGHATLASAFVVLNYINPLNDTVIFHSKSGKLAVNRVDELFSMDFPSFLSEPCEAPNVLYTGLGKKPIEILCSRDYLVLYSNEKEVLNINPDFEVLKNLDCGIIITAKGDTVDFVSRFFAPKYGINEDPVTGSAHCILTPYWAKKLKKKNLHAIQISKRRGELFCEDAGDRTIISGRAVEFMRGRIKITL